MGVLRRDVKSDAPEGLLRFLWAFAKPAVQTGKTRQRQAKAGKLSTLVRPAYRHKATLHHARPAKGIALPEAADSKASVKHCLAADA